MQHTAGCACISKSRSLLLLGDLEDENGSFEVLWIELRLTRLPRGVSSIITGVVYHPPTATNVAM